VEFTLGKTSKKSNVDDFKKELNVWWDLKTLLVDCCESFQMWARFRQ
jgi:hypothetical protein